MRTSERVYVLSLLPATRREGQVNVYTAISQMKPHIFLEKIVWTAQAVPFSEDAYAIDIPAFAEHEMQHVWYLPLHKPQWYSRNGWAWRVLERLQRRGAVRPYNHRRRHRLRNEMKIRKIGLDTPRGGC